MVEQFHGLPGGAAAEQHAALQPVRHRHQQTRLAPGIHLIVGWLFILQGFGAALVSKVWGHSFGVTGIIEHFLATPWWTGLIIGVIGLTAVIAGHRLRSKDTS
ncbi:hypothetical protein [Streptosporangium sandarakinum]